MSALVFTKHRSKRDNNFLVIIPVFLILGLPFSTLLKEPLKSGQGIARLPKFIVQVELASG
jgi:hypothetical protein